MTELIKPKAQNGYTEFTQSSDELLHLINERVAEADGWISFAEFMHMALYTPRLGYYSGGAQKIGNGGDFVTAPEMSPLFAQCLSRQVAQVLDLLPNKAGSILELGAGTGQLAVDVLLTLEQLGTLPEQYYILEVSDHLRCVQQEKLGAALSKDLIKRVKWLTELPAHLSGVVIGNEVLDAIPVHLVQIKSDGPYERGIAVNNGRLTWSSKKLASSNLLHQQLILKLSTLNLPNDYITELCPAAEGLIASLGGLLVEGAILLVDYGFSSNEYYHPQRNLGTLMCHYRQQAHTDPLINIGRQDVTAHVDFTSIAYAGVNAGLTLNGYCSQAQFLMNCGILERLNEVSPADVLQYVPLAAAAQKLLSPAEMGDLFKVIGFSKKIEAPLIGFSRGDKSHTL